jgi:hypothetical protein
VGTVLGTVGALVAWVGGCAVVGIPIWLLMDGHDRLVRHRFARLRPSSCAELAATSPVLGRVAVSGVTAPGPAGMLTAPLSGKPCVWYRVNVGWTSDGEHGPDDVTAWSRVEGNPTAVDDGTGRVLVSRWLLDRSVDGEDEPGLVKRSLSTREPVEVDAHLELLRARGVLPARKLAELARYDERWVAEGVVRAGRDVVAVGFRWRSRHGPMLVPHPLGTSGMSRKSLATLRERAVARVGPDRWWTAPLFLLGTGAVLLGCGLGAMFLGGTL